MNKFVTFNSFNATAPDVIAEALNVCGLPFPQNRGYGKLIDFIEDSAIPHDATQSRDWFKKSKGIVFVTSMKTETGYGIINRKHYLAYSSEDNNVIPFSVVEVEQKDGWCFILYDKGEVFVHEKNIPKWLQNTDKEIFLVESEAER